MAELTRHDMVALRRALHYAVQDRMGMASSWPGGTPERKAAIKLARDFDRLHKKLFGEPTAYTQQVEADRNTPSISIQELSKRGGGDA